ncbi:MAG: DUF4870 domain-containing protein [Microbacteriaceae bacterium]
MSTPNSDKLSTQEERQWVSLGDILGIVGFFIPSLIVWLVGKDRSAFVASQAKESLNFQISIAIYFVAASILAAVTLGLLSLLPLAVWIVMVIFCIIAFTKTKDGNAYTYPLTIRIIK